MKNIENKKRYIIIAIITLLLITIGGTYAYLSWSTTSNQKTNIVFTVQDKFSCAADGGGNITSSDIVLAPTDCTNSDYAIKREIKVTPTIYTNLSITMSLWLEINELGEGLSNSQNFRYALTTSDNSCVEGLVTGGNFNGKKSGDTITLLDSKLYRATTTDTYYLYVWLDKEEIESSSMNQSFDLSLNGSCVETPDKGVPTFEYTGDYEIVDDDDNVIEDPENWTDNWKIRFLTSGELTFTELNSAINGIDIFLVGGGGGGGSYSADHKGGGGGAGGYTTTQKNFFISTNIDYSITVGAGGSTGSAGESTIAFNVDAKGGAGGSGINGGRGGSGGGGGGYSYDFYAGVGGSDGSAGNSGSGSGGLGQVTTTREFEDSTATIYAGGGGGGAGQGSNGWGPVMAGGEGGGGAGGSNSNGVDGLINTGGGGGGGAFTKTGGAGGSGIVIIRNARTSISYNTPNFVYTGKYEIIPDDNENNWKIRFLTSGTLTFTELKGASNGIDVFLVGGGGGGGSYSASHKGGGGGAGGYTTTQTNISISINTDYLISIGAGGSAGSAGESTSAFDVVANGGGGGYNIAGGSGGSGGGGGGYSYDFYAGVGGSDGSAGNSGSGSGGLGQATTTREFEDSTATIYAGGGGGGAGQGSNGWGPVMAGGEGGGGAGGSNSNGVDGLINTGGGGGGGAYTKTGGSGGSGIVIIRNAR